MNDPIRNTIIRFAIIFLAIFLAFAGVLGYIIYIQTAEKNRWLALAEGQIKKDVPIPPTRGNILSANGDLLATSIPRYTVFMDTRVEALHLGSDTLFYRHVDSLAFTLSRVVKDKTPAEYKQRMVQAFKNGKQIRIVDGSINYLQKKQLEEYPLIRKGVYKSGFQFVDQHKRIKPFGSLSSRTIGSIYGESGQGNAGLEKSFDTYLSGKPGIAVQQSIAGHKEQVPVKEAVNGYDVVTTLDPNLMDICEANLIAVLKHTQADWGCVILMETKTGQIKAISNLDRTEDGSYVERVNHAVTRVEPGSTFKTIALMAALDDGKIDIDDTVSVTAKSWNYNGSLHTDSHPRDTIYTVQSALAVSSNIAFAKIITTAYEKKAGKFVDKLTRMGITQGFESEIPGASPPRIEVPNDAVTLSKMAYGYALELSPMQLLAFYNGIANNGKMITPYMVSRIEKNGEVIKSFSSRTIKSSLCSSGTLRDVKAALHDVVWDNQLGTASVLKWKGLVLRPKAQSDLVHIAGKTGTAQILGPNGYSKKKHRMTFVGYFPEEAPEYTCICMVHHPHNYGAYDAGLDCGTTVRKIAEETMAYAFVYEKKNDELIFHRK